MSDFEIVKSTRGNKPAQNNPVTVTKPGTNAPTVSGKDKLLGAAADNFGEILNLAGDLIELGKIKVVSDAVISQMAEKRKNLLAATDAYIRRKKADTAAVIDKMTVVRLMMSEFYEFCKQNVIVITSEDFRACITEIVNQMGRIEHGS